MKDKYLKIAQNYQQTTTKKYLLIPAIKRALSKSKKTTIIDIGCGTGDFYPIVNRMGYKYSGFDISKAMISLAKKRYPKANFDIYSSTNFSSSYKTKFGCALINLLFEQFGKKEYIIKTLSETNKVLKKNGVLIIGIQNPNYDQYMRFGLFGKQNVKTKFQGYFKRPIKYLLKYDFPKGISTFYAFHWALEDYVNTLSKLGFKIISFDECKPVFPSIHNFSKKKLIEKRKYPTYVVITAKKDKISNNS